MRPFQEASGSGREPFLLEADRDNKRGSVGRQGVYASLRTFFFTPRQGPPKSLDAAL